MNVGEICAALRAAGRLEASPVVVYPSEALPPGGKPTTDVDRCVAKALMTLAVTGVKAPLYLGKETLDGCCGGGRTYLGFSDPDPGIKYFVSTGSKDFMNGAAEYLRATPEIVVRNTRAVGPIKPPGRYIVFKALSTPNEDIPTTRSVVCFGGAEQIRNLCALIHFRSEEPFFRILAPSGPACASFVTYAAGMAQNAPSDAAYLGPFDPTVNVWLPRDYMTLAIPIAVARRMAEDLNSSFIVKRPKTAYPSRREDLPNLTKQS